MSWAARLALRYLRDGDRTVGQDRHEGPLRVLRPLYPEGPGICHHVIVHPPGGVVGGDTLDVDLQLGTDAHAVVTTPGATRYYRSDGAPATQAAMLALADGARLEWLPLEAIAYRGCIAESRVVMALQPQAQMLGWDVLALGLPAAGQPFDSGRYRQHLELPGTWLERGLIDGSDSALLDGALGLAGHRVAGTLWFAAGAALPAALRDALLEAARDRIAAAETLATGNPVQRLPAGATAAHAPLVVVRALAHRVEPLMALLQAVRADWRRIAWGLRPNPPRIWRS